MAQVFRFEYFGQVGHRVYAGASARSRKGQVVYSCPCGERFRADIWLAVDTNDPASVERLCAGSLNRVRCTSCGAQAEVQVPVVYHDLGTPRLVLVLPEGLRHRELEERARLFHELAADLEPPPLYVLEPEVVFGAAGLRAALAPTPSSGDFQVATPATPTPKVDLLAIPTPLPTPIPAALHPPLGNDTTEQTPVSDVATRLKINVPDPRQTVIDRWIASREGPGIFLVEETVLACAALAPESLEFFLSGPIELRVQLHRLPNYPVVALTMVAGKQDGQRIEDLRVLTIPLDVARAAHRVVLESLGRKARFTLELYDHEYLPVVAHQVTGSLEENVRRIIGEAKDALERIAPATRSFERARTQLMAPKHDRLGRTDVDLPAEELLEKPSAIRAALHAVARWSEPSAEAYLLEIRSLPLGVWRALRSRVIRRALDAGIAVPKPLVERSAKEHMAPLPSWQELLEIGVRRFAEVSGRQRPNDLTAAEEAENWEALLRECALAGVAVDDTVRSLAAAAQKRARANNKEGSGVDLRSLESDELVALLERKELRHEAALILCERHDPEHLPAVFSAIRRMARGEANVVLPAVTAFGTQAEKWLVSELSSKKSFMRQGCALALGTLKTPQGVDALVHLLLDEPTEIWSEIARALGDAGPMAVMPLAAKLRDVDAEKRERIVRALAQIACRPENQARSPVEMLAEGRDALVATAAQRALELAEDVLRDHQVVRRGSGDATVVRGFSRRFYEALGGGVVELSAGDLEEITPDDEDGDDGDDEDLRTATDLPALTRAPERPLEREDSTAPTPRTTLPRDR